MTTAPVTERARVLDAHTVSLGGRLFPIQGRVMRSLFSRFPSKVATGDIGIEFNPVISTVTFRDRRGGIGVETMEASQVDSVWYSNMSLRHRDHLVLQSLVTQTASAAVADVNELSELASAVYVAQATAVYKYSTSADTWTSETGLVGGALLNSATDSINLLLNGSETMAFATGSEVDYKVGSTWARDTRDISLLAEWRDLLWGLDSSGNLFYTRALGSGADGWTATNAQVPEPANSARRLLTGPEPSGDPEDALYVATLRGLYVYDNENERFIKTRLRVPFHPDNGSGTVARRESIYYNAGLAIYRITPGPVTQISLVGPDLVDGLPTDQRGAIAVMADSHNDLIIGLDSSGASDQEQQLFTGKGFGATLKSGQRQAVFASELGVSPIMGWNGQEGGKGWEVKWDAGSQGKGINALLVSNAEDQYRLWWGHNKRVYYTALPTDIVNPRQTPSQNYTSSGHTDFPFFGLEAVPKTALQFRLEAQDCNDSNTLQLQYALNFDDSDTAFVTVATQAENGERKYRLPLGVDDERGVPFDSIRARVNARRGAAATSSPDLIKLSLDYIKELDPLWAFTFTVDATDGRYGRSAREKRDFIEATVALRGLSDFSYRDELDNEENAWVKMWNVRGLEGTGYTDKFLYEVTVVEAIGSS